MHKNGDIEDKLCSYLCPCWHIWWINEVSSYLRVTQIIGSQNSGLTWYIFLWQNNTYNSFQEFLHGFLSLSLNPSSKDQSNFLQNCTKQKGPNLTIHALVQLINLCQNEVINTSNPNIKRFEAISILKNVLKTSWNG